MLLCPSPPGPQAPAMPHQPGETGRWWEGPMLGHIVGRPRVHAHRYADACAPCRARCPFSCRVHTSTQRGMQGRCGYRSASTHSVNQVAKCLLLIGVAACRLLVVAHYVCDRATCWRSSGGFGGTGMRGRAWHTNGGRALGSCKQRCSPSGTPGAADSAPPSACRVVSCAAAR